jgi:hypothetical protein
LTRSTLTQSKSRSGSGGGGGGGGGSKINSLYDLINAQVSIPDSNGKAQIFSSPLNDPSKQQQLLPLVLDKLTTNKPGTVIPGRINVNTAPAAVLAVLPSINPNITSSDVQNILANRPDYSSSTNNASTYLTPAWLVTQANISPKVMKSLEKYITARSQVFRVQSVGYFPNGGPSARVEAVIDTNAGLPRIIYYRDLTELGKGFDLSGGGN